MKKLLLFIRTDYNHLKKLIFFQKRDAKRKSDRIPFLQKSIFWEYEKEVRVFRLQGPGISKYNCHALKEIYFGFK